MINFKEHDCKLFKMLEKPVPLKEKDTNVLVQFITHGIIGEYVMEHWLDCNQENVPIFVDSVDSDGDVTVGIERGSEHLCCPFPMFEIIGTPVKEGSDDWAWYQMMQGEKISGTFHKPLRFYAIKKGCDYCALYENDGNEVRINTRRTYGEFIEYSKRCRISSWKIYKEPKVGDWIEFIDAGGRKSQGKYLSKAYDNAILVREITFNTRCVVPTAKIIRKLSPADIVIHIGCLSGTVRRINDIFFCLNPSTEKGWVVPEARIPLAMLDTPTAELVRELLKAQEEE